ncbi:SAM hydrolase/SAM-dependent halogenase family protein [Phytoactinopolyspora limicola]|uniref:SAM hydrolase/SAM-dependent halogenase family protein n=1 Tax=Phytoactinopolyspora limicola TaxID=2715536 RepID=UPI00140DDA8B|nr:SAM-dependent chlorinase/fluorinase [Phytoactinopolyspora limicola]
MARPVFFLTDYGRRDGFVAACHGVMLRITPGVRIVDVTHDVPAQDVRHGAVVLAQTVPYLPPAVLVAVVDPGVGAARRAVAIEVGDHVLVGPDNGLLPWAAGAAGEIRRVVELTNAAYLLETTAVTFHGRDVFAPAAAHVAAGTPVSALGPAVDPADLVRLPEPRVSAGPGVVDTEAHVVDHFGNVALAARADHLTTAGLSAGQVVRVQAGDTGQPLEASVGRIFADVAPGELVLYVDSHGYVALAENHGNAAARLGVAAGDPVVVSVAPPR